VLALTSAGARDASAAYFLPAAGCRLRCQVVPGRLRALGLDHEGGNQDLARITLHNMIREPPYPVGGQVAFPERRRVVDRERVVAARGPDRARAGAAGRVRVARRRLRSRRGIPVAARR